MRLRTMIDRVVCEREVTPVFEAQYELIVLGLGTAGSLAAITGGELGLSTLGVERQSGMGGTGTLGNVLDYYYGQGGGRLESVNADCEALLSGGGYLTSRRQELIEQGRISYPAAVKSYVLERRAVKAGVRLCYDTVLVGVYLDENRFAGLRLATGSRIWDVGAKVLIDATGEAEAAFVSGCPMQEGRAADHGYAWFSKTFTMHEPGYLIGAWRITGQVNQASAESLSEANLQAMRASHALAKDRSAVHEAPFLCFREGRRILAREMLTLRDYLEERYTNQPVFYACSHIDLASREYALEDEFLQNFMYICDLRGLPLIVPVPLEALIARDVEGLLVAGRCLGVDHDLCGCVRMKLDMEKSGEAAATLAWAAIRRNVAPSVELYHEVAQVLRGTGCLDEAQNHPFHAEYRDGEDLLCALSGREAGIAMWSAVHNPECSRQVLFSGLRSDTPEVRRRCALVLGILGEPEALPLLREMAENTQEREWSQRAVCLLGRCGTSEDGERLLRVLRHVIPLSRETGEQENPWVFMLAECVMAILKLSSRTGQGEWAAELRRELYAPDFSARASEYGVDLTATLRNMAMGG